MYLPAMNGPTADDAGCELTAKGPNLYEIAIHGKFLPGWLGAFTAGLAQKRLNILGASARKVHASAWTATFLVDSRTAREAIDSIDFLALANGRPAAGNVTIALEGCRLEPTADGALLVEIRAEDQLGFLTAMLKHFTLFSLFPSELQIETTVGRIHDRFWLRGVGGTVPSTETVRALRAELQKLITTMRPAFTDSFALRPAIA